MKLNTKTTFIYLIFTGLILMLGGYFTIQSLDKRTKQFILERIEHNERKIIHALENENEFKSRNPFLKIEELSFLEMKDTSFYKDTLIVHHSTEEKFHFKAKISFKNINGTLYKIQILKSTQEFQDMKKLIINLLIILFIVIFALTAIFNILLSNFLWQPFYKVVNHMKKYSLQKNVGLNIKTNTTEFKELEQFYKLLLMQIERDYINLKEYTENMAHEIQTPLAIIRNKALRLIENNDLSEVQLEKIKTIYEEIDSLSKLSQTLNLITKIENSEFKNIQTIVTKEYIESHLTKLEEIASLKDLTLHADLDPKQKLAIDPFLFEIILKNLLKNAIRYTEPNQQIQIISKNDILRFENPGKELENGSENIFKRFYRGDNTKSIGLGLAIVKKICDLNQMEISYRYKEGKHIIELQLDAGL